MDSSVPRHAKKRVLEASSEVWASGRWMHSLYKTEDSAEYVLKRTTYVTNALISLHVFVLHHCLVGGKGGGGGCPEGGIGIGGKGGMGARGCIAI